MANFSFVIDSSFRPFSMQEMLVPFAAYKEASEQAENTYQELSEKADKFKYLSETLPEGSKAREIYEGYANGLRSQAEDFNKYGLSMGNRRALNNYKRRYAGEIGQLVEAETALKKQQELRQTMSAKDPSMLYATNNMTIDDFLFGKNPNLYGVSGTSLYARGANLGKAISSRIYSAKDGNSVLGGMYKDWIQTAGVSQESIAAFMQKPEVQQAIDNVLIEQGVTDNLTGSELNKARQSVLNGMYEGIVYTESHSPQRDLNKMTAAEKDASSLSWANYRMQKQAKDDALQIAGLTRGADGKLHYDVNNDVSLQKQKDILGEKAKLKATSGKANGSSSGKGYQGLNKQPVAIGAKTGKYYSSPSDAVTLTEFTEDYINGSKSLSSEQISKMLTDKSANADVLKGITNGNFDDYQISILSGKGDNVDGTDEDILIFVPRDIKNQTNPYTIYTNTDDSFSTSTGDDTTALGL